MCPSGSGGTFEKSQETQGHTTAAGSVSSPLTVVFTYLRQRGGAAAHTSTATAPAAMDECQARTCTCWLSWRCTCDLPGTWNLLHLWHTCTSPTGDVNLWRKPRSRQVELESGGGEAAREDSRRGKQAREGKGIVTTASATNASATNASATNARATNARATKARASCSVTNTARIALIINYLHHSAVVINYVHGSVGVINYLQVGNPRGAPLIMF